MTDEQWNYESQKLLIKLKISENDAQYLAEATNLQSKSLLWFEHQKGRVTASHFGEVSKTSMDNPSRSLIEAILQSKRVAKVTALECKSNEDIARKAYISAVGNQHSSFEVQPTGLHLHINYPYVGASPDGLVFCSCCGPGLLEIKCP